MTAKSRQITIASAGTAQQGPDTPPGLYVIGGHPSNTGNVCFGNDGLGDVTMSNGFVLGPGTNMPVQVYTLSSFWFDADNDDDVVCILMLERFNSNWISPSASMSPSASLSPSASVSPSASTSPSSSVSPSPSV